jgi:ribonuclease E
VTSLGLVQMTRKKIGTGLLEAFSETCDTCHGRGVVVHAEPIEPSRGSGDERGSGNGQDSAQANDSSGEGSGRRGRRGGRGRSGRGDSDDSPVKEIVVKKPTGPWPGEPRRVEPDTAAEAPDAAPASQASDGVAPPEPEAAQPSPDATPDSQVAQPLPEATPEPAAVEKPAAAVAEPPAPAKRTRRRASRPAAPPAPVSDAPQPVGTV